MAGRLFDRDRPADGALDGPDSMPPVVLNETAVRSAGLRARRQAAIGKTVIWHGFWDESLRQRRPVRRPAAVRDHRRRARLHPRARCASRSAHRSTASAAIAPPSSIALNIKLDGQRIAETVGRHRPALEAGRRAACRCSEYFVDQFTLRLYIDTMIQGATIAIAARDRPGRRCLGLFALSAYTTERRTKEIGVRKAMGASSGRHPAALLWQFTKPVLWANLIAWPAGVAGDELVAEGLRLPRGHRALDLRGGRRRRPWSSPGDRVLPRPATWRGPSRWRRCGTSDPASARRLHELGFCIPCTTRVDAWALVEVPRLQGTSFHAVESCGPPASGPNAAWPWGWSPWPTVSSTSSSSAQDLGPSPSR